MQIIGKSLHIGRVQIDAFSSTKYRRQASLFRLTSRKFHRGSRQSGSGLANHASSFPPSSRVHAYLEFGVSALIELGFDSFDSYFFHCRSWCWYGMWSCDQEPWSDLQYYSAAFAQARAFGKICNRYFDAMIYTSRALPNIILACYMKSKTGLRNSWRSVDGNLEHMISRFSTFHLWSRFWFKIPRA